MDTDALLALAGMTSESVADVDGEVTLSQMQAFWKHAYRFSGDPYLAMHAGKVARYFGLINTMDRSRSFPGRKRSP